MKPAFLVGRKFLCSVKETLDLTKTTLSDLEMRQRDVPEDFYETYVNAESDKKGSFVGLGRQRGNSLGSEVEKEKNRQIQT